MNDPSIRQQIRGARAKFAAMAASYSLGAFNDNFFKQAAMLLALGGRKRHDRSAAATVWPAGAVAAVQNRERGSKASPPEARGQYSSCPTTRP